MTEDYEGILVLGMPRSGTTLVRRLLDAHPNISCPPETNLLGAADRFLKDYRFAGGLAVGVLPSLEFCGFSEEESVARLREFIFGFWRDIAQRAGKRRWAEKTAVDIFHLDAVEKICGDRCRHVCVVRNPLDVVCSLKELSDKIEGYLPELHDYVRRFDAPYAAFAHAWRDGNERLLAFIESHRDSAILVRYEDLVSAPAPTLAHMFRFLNETTDVEALLKTAFDETGSVGLGDWKTYETRGIGAQSVDRHAALSTWTVSQLAPVVSPLMARMGYPPLHTPNPTTAADEKRLGELGRLVARMKMAAKATGDKTPEG